MSNIILRHVYSVQNGKAKAYHLKTTIENQEKFLDSLIVLILGSYRSCERFLTLNSIIFTLSSKSEFLLNIFPKLDKAQSLSLEYALKSRGARKTLIIIQL